MSRAGYPYSWLAHAFAGGISGGASPASAPSSSPKDVQGVPAQAKEKTNAQLEKEDYERLEKELGMQQAFEEWRVGIEIVQAKTERG